jgi:hypothetical protein
VPQRRVLKSLLVILVLIIAGAVFVPLSLRHSAPTGVAGPEADALAHQLERVVHVDAWARTGAVRWSQMGREHLWDRQRNFDRFRFRGAEVLLDVGRRDGVAFRNGQPVGGEAGRKLVADAYRWFCNDSFWLNPLAKLFDDGVTRYRVDEGGRPALLVQYGAGGVTPGDRYLWLLDAEGRPRAWRTWVSVFKVGGIEFTWDRWTELSTGALVSTEHHLAGLKVLTLDVAAAPTLAALEPGPDPFAPLTPK